MVLSLNLQITNAQSPITITDETIAKKTIFKKMTLEQRINEDLKNAMRAKDEVGLRSIRAVKAAIQIARTDASGGEMTEEREVKILQKLVKQRKESLDIFMTQNREDLAVKEREEIAIIEKYLPAMLEGEALEAIIKQIIAMTGATSAKDMGKVMGVATKQLAGKADGKAISGLVKQLLG
jgi:uncharacterized protein